MTKYLIIGAGGGIGSEVAKQLGSEAELVLAGRDTSKIDSALGEVVELDATNFDAVEQVFQEHGPFDGVVNCAGSIMLKAAHQTKEEEYSQVLDTNLKTAFAVARAAGKNMRGGGSVVFVSTTAANVGTPNHEAIAAAKGGVQGLVLSAAATYAPNNLRFNAVAPGLTNTPLAANIVNNEMARKASEAMMPLGRIGEPDEVARLIVFLLKPENSWITGQVICIDGGMANLRGKVKL